jgi:hypothetical protein
VSWAQITPTAWRRPSSERLEPYPLLGCGVGGAGTISVADYSIRLRTLLTFDDIELDVVAFFERFVSVQLNR